MNTLPSLLALIALFASHVGQPTNGSVVELPEDAVVVVIYTGQSNTFGTGSLVTEPGYVPDYDPDDLPGCYIWDQLKRDSRLSMSLTDRFRGGERHRFRPLTRGYGRSSVWYPWEDMPNALSLGAELQLAHRLRQAYRRPVFIVKCAKGSVPLYQVADRRAGYPYPAPPLPELPNTLYNWDWNRASDVDTGGGDIPGKYSMFKLWRDYYWRGAMRELLDEVNGERSLIYLAGVVHFQGAADANPALQPGQWQPGRAAADAFESNLSALVDGFRDTLSPGLPDSVPIVLARSEDYFDANGDAEAAHPFIFDVRRAQEAVQAATPNSVLLSTDRLSMPDGEHFDAAAQQQLGDRIFEALTAVNWLRGPFGE